MFDAVVGDLSERYGLGDRSRELFGLLLGYIFNDRRGGFGGFVENFREQGHGELVASWFGNPASPRPLNAGDVGTVFGQGLLNDWSNRLGTSRATLAAAIAGILPRLVAELTPGGRLPAGSGTPFSGERPAVAEGWTAPVVAEPSRLEPIIAPIQPAPMAHAEENRADAMLAAFAAPSVAAATSAPAFEPHFRSRPLPPPRKRRSWGWLLWLAVIALIAGGVYYAWWLGLLDPYLKQLGLG